ncbi:MAG: hypothetical protein IT198_04410 [Acidimicrobiia bacterium]|nr:hypothetical protein [Acidimicrobiia bacterium]
MTDATVRATFADRQYLRRPGPLDPWVPALELSLSEETTVEDLRAALAHALEAEPRFAAIPVGRGRHVRWKATGVAPEISTGSVASEDEWRAAVVDTPFGPQDPALRVAMRDRRILLAWRHAVSDAAGGIGLCSLITRALRGEALRVADGDGMRRVVGRSIWKEAVGPASLMAFTRKVRAFGAAPHTELPTTRPLAASSTSRIAHFEAGAGAGTFTGRVVAAVVAECAALMPGDAPVTLLLPVNLRPRERWFPVGNFVGNVELSYATPPDVDVASADVHHSRGPERYSAWLASAVREALPAGVGHRGEGSGGRLGRSAAVNNLGRVDSALLPGCDSVAFHGPTAVDLPSISLVSLGTETALCVRVRDHQGGGDVAGALLERLVSRLGNATR